jgi:UDP-N-acetylglucosamine acyltransferase
MANHIHPSAIISPEAELAPDVRVGALAIIEGAVKIGAGTVIHPRAHLIGPLIMGQQNEVHPNAVLGGKPQHLQYRDEPTRLEIGDGNTFRENVTVHRGTTHSWVTRLGDGNYLMAGSHVGHDVQMGNRCILANNVMLAGHCTLDDGVYISGGSGVHQFCRLGRLAFLSGLSALTKDQPPFIIQQNFNRVCGVNVIGMRRAGMTSDQINAIRRLYHIVYLQHLTFPNALAKVEAELGRYEAVQEYLRFARESKRGICGVQGPARYADMDMAA